jgi:adenosylhomocysteine nucleosidase
MIGIVTGLIAEARAAAPLGDAVAGGGTPRGAAVAAKALMDRGATALISFGLAGGLKPGLPPGTLIIPACIRTAHADHPADAALTAWLGGPAGTLYAGTELAVTAADKAALHAATGADAIDLESGAVADVAASHGVRFAVLRAICDHADRNLPPAAIIALDARGAIALARVAASVLRHPAQLPALLGLARDAARARAALVRQVRLCGQARSE